MRIDPPLELLVIRHKMLDSSCNALALQAVDVGSGNGAIQDWVLREGLKASTTERGPLCVNSGTKKNMGTLE